MDYYGNAVQDADKINTPPQHNVKKTVRSVYQFSRPYMNKVVDQIPMVDTIYKIRSVGFVTSLATPDIAGHVSHKMYEQFDFQNRTATGEYLKNLGFDKNTDDFETLRTMSAVTSDEQTKAIRSIYGRSLENLKGNKHLYNTYMAKNDDVAVVVKKAKVNSTELNVKIHTALKDTGVRTTDEIDKLLSGERIYDKEIQQFLHSENLSGLSVQQRQDLEELLFSKNELNGFMTTAMPTRNVSIGSDSVKGRRRMGTRIITQGVLGDTMFVGIETLRVSAKTIKSGARFVTSAHSYIDTRRQVTRETRVARRAARLDAIQTKKTGVYTDANSKFVEEWTERRKVVRDRKSSYRNQASLKSELELRRYNGLKDKNEKLIKKIKEKDSIIDRYTTKGFLSDKEKKKYIRNLKDRKKYTSQLSANKKAVEMMKNKRKVKAGSGIIKGDSILFKSINFSGIFSALLTILVVLLIVIAIALVGFVITSGFAAIVGVLGNTTKQTKASDEEVSYQAFNYGILHELGVSDEYAAAYIGMWQGEGSNRPDRIEGDYKFHPEMTLMLNDKEAEKYTKEKLFPMYKKSGVTINKEAYKGNDGVYRPGIGIFAWTGPKAEALLKYAKKHKLDWWTLECQWGFTLSTDEWSRLKGHIKKSKTLEKALKDVIGFETGDGASEKAKNIYYTKRIDLAKDAYKAIKNGEYDYDIAEVRQIITDNGLTPIKRGDTSKVNSYLNKLAKQNDIDSDTLKVLKAGTGLIGVTQYSMENRNVSGCNNPDYLDCSSFVSWAINKGYKKKIVDYSSNTTLLLSNPNFKKIKLSKMKPGDLLFRYDNGAKVNQTNHVLIYCGKLNGNNVFMHCTSGGHALDGANPQFKSKYANCVSGVMLSDWTIPSTATVRRLRK